jgi:CRP/FNR family transcriptional regulator, cyclic AMP receptor protein
MGDFSNKDELLKVLSRVAIFSDIKENVAALESLSQLMEIKKFSPGHRLIEEGALGDEFFILLEGQVSIYRRTPEGDTYKVVILKGDSHPALGEGGLVEAEPRTATVITDHPTICLVLTRERFAQFCNASPAWALPIFKKIATTLMGRLKQTSTDLMLLHKALMHEIRG